MVMPSASLTLFDKILIDASSGCLFLGSYWWCGHEWIRAVAISSPPRGFALFCKHARPFASPETRDRMKREREKRKKEEEELRKKNLVYYYEDPLDEPSFAKKCLVLSTIQLTCGVSGLLNYYPSVILKSALVFHILMTVQDSIETRPAEAYREELKKERAEKLKLESAIFWKGVLPSSLWRLLGFGAVVKNAASNDDDDDDGDGDDTSNKSQSQKEKILHKVKVTKNIVTGKNRETAVEDLLWGVIQIAYVIFDATNKQALGTAIVVYLCSLLENILTSLWRTEKGKIRRVPWIKISWILVCLYLNAKWFLSA